MSVDLYSVGPAPIDPAATQVMVPMRDGVRLATDPDESDYPLFVPDPGTGEDAWTATESRRVPYELRSGSVVTLSVLPRA